MSDNDKLAAALNRLAEVQEGQGKMLERLLGARVGKAEALESDPKPPLDAKYRGKKYYVRTTAGWSGGKYRDAGEVVTLRDAVPSRTFRPITEAQAIGLRKSAAKKKAVTPEEKLEAELAALDAEDGKEEPEEEPEEDAEIVDEEAAPELKVEEPAADEPVKVTSVRRAAAKKVIAAKKKGTAGKAKRAADAEV